jgi:hypothetical protein
MISVSSSTTVCLAADEAVDTIKAVGKVWTVKYLDIYTSKSNFVSSNLQVSLTSYFLSVIREEHFCQKTNCNITAKRYLNIVIKS